MGCKQRYAKGQILVAFNDGCSKHFAEEFGEKIGYELIEEWEHDNISFLYKTPVGKELEACEKFKSYTEFIDFATLRDLKLESRWESLEQAISMLESLRDDAEIPDKEYNQRLGKIVDYLRKEK